ncbi:MAG: MFS transporter [Ardenticatenales bacterium]|nr:MFS transporter [Ardenticatenales bacterium]
MTDRIPNYRRNMIAFLGDYIGFALAMTLTSTTAILPDFVGRLTDSLVVVGVFTSVSTGAWLFPQLIFARFLITKERKKPYVILGGVIGRPLYLLYAVALGLGLGRYPVPALLLLLLVQFFFFVTDSLAAVAWLDMLAKALPEAQRGRMISIAQLISGVLSIGAGVMIAALLSADGPPFPNNYAVILAAAGVSLVLSLLACVFIVEPTEPVEEQRPSWSSYLPDLLSTLRQDRSFARVIMVRLLAGFDGLATGFYILFAIRELGLPPETVGLFTAAQTAGRILASLGLGRLSQRVGSHRVIQVATAISLTAPLTALALSLAGGRAGAATITIYAWIYVVIGVVTSAGMLGFMNYVLELAPAGSRPTYIGLFNTISGVLVLLPTAGGFLLGVSSYNVLFVLTAAVLAVAHVLSWHLPPARQARTMLAADPVTWPRKRI